MIVSGEFYSKTLEMDTGVSVVIPNDLLAEGGYRVAYLLHGLGGTHNSWVNNSLLHAYAAHGRTIYVMPDVGRSFYANMKHGFRYLAYVTEELPEICRSLFSISSRREDTVVMGNSMGGYGALVCGLNRPDRYGMCGAFSSPCLFLREYLEMLHCSENKGRFIEEYGRRLYEDMICVFGDELVCGVEADVLGLAERVSGEGLEVYCTCGDGDMFVGENRRFAESMKGRGGIEFVYEEWAGEHNFEFFNESLRRAIARFGL